jgi:hypothetical protein
MQQGSGMTAGWTALAESLRAKHQPDTDWREKIDHQSAANLQQIRAYGEVGVAVSASLVKAVGDVGVTVSTTLVKAIGDIWKDVRREGVKECVSESKKHSFLHVGELVVCELCGMKPV